MRDTLFSMPAQRYFEQHTTSSIDAHVKLIARQVARSLQETETRQLAVKIVSNKVEYRKDPRTGKMAPFIQAWGQWFRAAEYETCPPRNDICEIVAIWNFVVLNCRYVYDIDEIDTFVTAEHTLKAGGGDCDDATVLFAALLKAIGFKVRARVIATKDAPDNWAHIYPLVGVSKDNPKQWIPLDCTVKDVRPGWEYDSIAAIRDYTL